MFIRVQLVSNYISNRSFTTSLLLFEINCLLFCAKKSFSGFIIYFFFEFYGKWQHQPKYDKFDKQLELAQLDFRWSLLFSKMQFFADWVTTNVNSVNMCCCSGYSTTKKVISVLNCQNVTKMETGNRCLLIFKTCKLGTMMKQSFMWNFSTSFSSLSKL